MSTKGTPHNKRGQRPGTARKYNGLTVNNILDSMVAYDLYPSEREIREWILGIKEPRPKMRKALDTILKASQ